MDEKGKLENEMEILLESFQLKEENLFNKKQNLEESINLEGEKVNNEDVLNSEKIDNITDIIQNLIILDNNKIVSNDSLNDEKIYYNNRLIDKKEYFLDIIKSMGKFLKDKNNIKEFINTFEISQFVYLFSSKYMTSKSLLFLLKYLNIILREKSEYIKDILVNQVIFHLSRYIFIFKDMNIKIQICFFIHFCLISKPIIELFLSSGGIFLLNSFLNSEFLKENEIIILLALDYLLYIFFQYGNEISLQLINNKILARLNNRFAKFSRWKRK